MVLVSLRDSYADTLAAAEGADLLVGNLATYAAGLVAEKKGIPWASVMHVPTLFFSAYDPPLFPGFPGISKSARFLGPSFWGPLGRFAKWSTRPLARPWHRFRQEIGLPPVHGVNPLTDWHSPRLHLALFSKQLLDKQPDWPAQTVVTGFPWFNQDSSAGLPPALSRFLDDGPPPIVFTLGTAVAANAGLFYESSARAASSLGRRAVLILNDPSNRPPSLPDGVAAFDYAPFAQLFPRAAAIVHHGGIGTTGLAMRSGRPMLVMPCAWDQPDNAEPRLALGHLTHPAPPSLYPGPRRIRATTPARKPVLRSARKRGRQSDPAREWSSGRVLGYREHLRSHGRFTSPAWISPVRIFTK